VRNFRDPAGEPLEPFIGKDLSGSPPLKITSVIVSSRRNGLERGPPGLEPFGDSLRDSACENNSGKFDGAGSRGDQERRPAYF